MDYEIRGNSVLGHSDQGTVVINLTYEGERHLGSLDLPLTQVEIMCIGYTDEQADSFLKHYDAAMFRAGGGYHARVAGLDVLGCADLLLRSGLPRTNARAYVELGNARQAYALAAYSQKNTRIT